jgi:hypothetical protein
MSAMSRPGNHHTIFIDPCPDCGGDGGFESMPTGHNPINGQPTTHWIECPTCDGGGEVWTEYECRTLEDLEREAEEDQQLADGTHYLDAAGTIQQKNT